jgi:hypothetical protein
MAARKRLYLDRKAGPRHRAEMIKWAANDHYDTVVFSLREKLKPNSKILKLAKRCSLNIEAGGCDFSLFVPRKLFFFHKELFRMEQGRRKAKHHFCPTNPKTTAVIKENAEKILSGFMQILTEPRVFNLLPDKGHENTWCACPACRAFSPAEQNIIAVNTVADVLAKLDPQARLVFRDIGEEKETSPADKAQSGISPRKNMIKA